MCQPFCLYSVLREYFCRIVTCLSVLRCCAAPFLCCFSEFAVNRPVTVIHQWRSNSNDGVGSVVLPDGCRDLIQVCGAGNASHWRVSELPLGPHVSRCETGSHLRGWRLAPGTGVKHAELLAAVSERALGDDELLERVLDNTRQCTRIQESLACLAQPRFTVADVARQLGVSLRTLQRLLLFHTGRGPAYWRALARVRKAARQMQLGGPLAALAVDGGFSDQPHMNREFRRWFGVSPTFFERSPDLRQQLLSDAYC